MNQLHADLITRHRRQPRRDRVIVPAELEAEIRNHFIVRRAPTHNWLNASDARQFLGSFIAFFTAAMIFLS